MSDEKKNITLNNLIVELTEWMIDHPGSEDSEVRFQVQDGLGPDGYVEEVDFANGEPWIILEDTFDQFRLEARDIHSIEWADEVLAYDGSSRPQSRLLTPRERDILTRILIGFRSRLMQISDFETGDETFTIRPEYLDLADFQWMRMDLEELQPMFNLIEVLTPRDDVR